MALHVFAATEPPEYSAEPDDQPGPEQCGNCDANAAEGSFYCSANCASVDSAEDAAFDAAEAGEE